MTRETAIAMLDYSKPPLGYRVEQGIDGFVVIDPQMVRHSAAMQNLGHGWRLDVAEARAWAHYKAEHDPPGLTVQSFRARALGLPDPKARATAWAWHDRRLAIVVDVDEQTCGGGKDLAAWLTKALAWTDAECAEIESYAALPFPRSVDMPKALQRVILVAPAEGTAA